MSFEKKNWTNRVSEYPTRRNLIKADGTSEIVTVERSEGTVSTEGDAFSAENMNDLEDRIEKEFEDVSGKVGSINVYVGDDKKLHFVDSEGADTVIPFSNYRKYVTYRTCSTGNADASIDICVYNDVVWKNQYYGGLSGDGIVDVLGLATLTYEGGLFEWTLTFLQPVLVNGVEYQVGDTISWDYKTEVEYEVVLRE